MLPTRLKAATGAAAPLPPKEFIVVAHATSPYISAYEWDDSTGFGTKIANPADLPPSTGTGVDSNSTPKTGTTSQVADIIFMSHGSSPYVSAYHFSRNGFGARVTAPSSPGTSTGNCVSCHPTLQAVAISSSSSPYLHAWAWNNTTKAWGAKYANPPTGLNTTTPEIHFRPTSTTSSGYIACAMGNTPRIVVFAFTISGGFGAKVANPSVIAASGRGCRFSENGNKVTLSLSSTPFIYVYPFTGTFGVKLTDPATNNRPGGSAYQAKFRAGDTALLIGHVGSPYVTMYAPWSTSTTTFPTKVANPSSLVSNTVYSCAFNSAEEGANRVVVGYNSSPYIAAWKWGDPTTNTWGTKFSNPSTNLPAYGRSVLFVTAT